MAEIGKTALQSLAAIVALFILARFMGKKLISQLTFFDYVAGITIGSAAAEFVVNPSVGYGKGIAAMIVFAAFPIVLSIASLKSYRGRRLLDGKPEILIWDGKIIEQNLGRTKMNVNDLLEECRQKDVFNIDDIGCAILETNGKLSVQLKAENRPLTPGDMNLPAVGKGLCANLILDGDIFDGHLALLGKDRDWLLSELRKQNIAQASDVLLAYADMSGKLYVHRKAVPPPPSPLA